MSKQKSVSPGSVGFAWKIWWMEIAIVREERWMMMGGVFGTMCVHVDGQLTGAGGDILTTIILS